MAHKARVNGLEWLWLAHKLLLIALYFNFKWPRSPFGLDSRHVGAALQPRRPHLGVIDQQFGDVVHRLLRGAGPEDLVPRVGLDLRELEPVKNMALKATLKALTWLKDAISLKALGVIRVHSHELLPGRRAQDLDDLHLTPLIYIFSI